MDALLHSRKFLLLCLDTVISLVIWFVGLYNPAHLDAAQQMIAILQPVFVAVIAGIAVEDAADKHGKVISFDDYEEVKRASEQGEEVRG